MDAPLEYVSMLKWKKCKACLGLAQNQVGHAVD